MKMQRTFLLITCTFFAVLAIAQQDSYEAFKQAQSAKFDQFKSDKQAEYDAFRKRVNEEYARMMEQAWEPFNTKPAVEEPVTPQVEPVINYTPQPEPQPEPEPQPQPEPEPEPVVIPVQEEPIVITPPAPTPEPIAPVVEPQKDLVKVEQVLFYGTTIPLKYPNPDEFKLTGLNEKQLAAAWKTLSDTKYDVLVSSALAARKQYSLCDWGYIQYLQTALEKHFGKTNEAVFVQSFLLTQSGYRVRLAKESSKIYLLIASNYSLFNHLSVDVKGIRYYVVNGQPQSIQICPSLFEKEQNVSLQIATAQKLKTKSSTPRSLKSQMGMKADVAVNQNLIDFYNNYPRSYINGDVTTLWVTYANTPLEKSTQDMLYPAIKESIKGLSERDAVNKILNWIQTAFEYGYDDQIWGGDRAFFATETLFYPYCDCEDRAILFSRLVRDIIGDEVALLYYPGHLAAAVNFKEDVRGDYLTCDGKKYVVCDPTFIVSNVGRTMPGMNNQKAKIIILK